MNRIIALLRGINVGGHRKVPMVQLKALAESLGYREAETYIQSGNLVFSTKTSAAKTEGELEKAIEKEFGFRADVIARDAKQWQRFVKTLPFAAAAEARPNLVLLALSKRPIAEGAEADLQARAKNQEKVRVVGDALWIDFYESVGLSKLTQSILERAVGSAVTMRNWKTVLTLSELLGLAA